MDLLAIVPTFAPKLDNDPGFSCPSNDAHFFNDRNSSKHYCLQLEIFSMKEYPAQLYGSNTVLSILTSSYD